MVDALVFDLDGTLWDASGASVLAWNEALKSLGFNRSVTIAELRGVTGKPIEECIRILFPDVLERHPDLLDVLEVHEKRVIKNQGGDFYDSLGPTLAYLSRKYPCFLVSNCQDWYLEDFLRISETGKYFTDCNCHGASNLGKTEMLVELKVKHGFAAPVYVGDTEGDERAARSAGYRFAFASYGFGVAHNPDFTIGALRDLMGLF